MGFIYKIENKINHKMYIGKTDYFAVEMRWNQHLRSINSARCKNRALYAAMNKYGVENFEFSVIEKTDNTSEREVYWIEFYNTYRNGYNETLGGDGRALVSVDIDELKKYYKDHTFSDACIHFNVSAKTLRNIMKQNNIEIISSKEVSQSRATKVNQLTKDGKIINTYASCHEAEMIVAGANNGHISRVCRGLRNTAYGYKWEYVA